MSDPPTENPKVTFPQLTRSSPGSSLAPLQSSRETDESSEVLQEQIQSSPVKTSTEEYPGPPRKLKETFDPDSKTLSVETGVIESTYDLSLEGEPPGTVLLEATLNHTTLHPIPSSDPNDPLNWAAWRKSLNFFLVLFFTVVAFSCNCIATVFWGQLNEELGFSFDQLNNGFALGIGGLGIGCPLLVPVAAKFGKRPVYLLATILVIASTFWQARMKYLHDYYAASFIEGLATSLCEAMIQMTIADLYFVHQRGTMNGIYMVVIAISNFLSLIPAGYIAASVNWNTNFWILGGLGAGFLVVSTFCLEETKYERLENETSTSSDSLTASGKMKWQLKPYTITPGTWNDFFRTFYTPFVVLVTFPIVLFVTLHYSFMLSWLAMCATTVANSFTQPPYDFSPEAIGNLNISPFVGLLIGSFYGGWLNDKSMLYLTKRNHGIYEPEMRLYMVIPMCLIMTAGIFMFGISIATGAHWAVPMVGFGVFAAGFGANGSITLTYLIDCYRDMISDAFIGIVVVRNIVGMVVTFCLSPWIDLNGLKNVFIIAGCLSLVPLLATPFMIKYGKQIRRMSTDKYERYKGGI
ncbi:putative MFS-type transporter [Yarrowia sp. B02]|nr:putative MFS-type transporter [Yarrowia sp. B02]